MKSSQNMTIIVLSVMAAVLLVMLVGLYTSDQASASTTARYGEYITASGRFGGHSLVYVINVDQNRLNVYYPNQTRSPYTIDLVAFKELDKMFAQ